jgi:hypothetical protein
MFNLNELTAVLDKNVKGIKYRVSDNAPSTFQDVLKQFTAGRELVIWSGGSDNTVWGSADNNYKFRAIHDLIHVKHGLDFTLSGELTVARIQAELFQSDQLGRLVIAEVQGQAEHYFETGEFPVNQIEFIKQYLTRGK